MPLLSVITCSHKPARGEWVRAQYAQAFPGAEIVVIEDAASLCEGYARGLASATGDRLIFTHDDIEFLAPHEAEATLARHLDTFDLIGIAGTSRLVGPKWTSAGDPDCYMLVLSKDDGPDLFVAQLAGRGGIVVSGIQALDGVFLACHRRVAESVGWDAATFDGFHLYDLDFTYRAHLAGFRLAVCRDLPLIHYGVGRLDEAWERAAQRFMAKHRLPGAPERRPIFVGARGTKAELARLCRPESLMRSIHW